MPAGVGRRRRRAAACGLVDDSGCHSQVVVVHAFDQYRGRIGQTLYQHSIGCIIAHGVILVVGINQIVSVTVIVILIQP